MRGLAARRPTASHQARNRASSATEGFWFTDPDGTHVEVDWVRDPSLAGFHAPVPVADVSQCSLPMP